MIVAKALPQQCDVNRYILTVHNPGFNVGDEVTLTIPAVAICFAGPDLWVEVSQDVFEAKGVSHA